MKQSITIRVPDAIYTSLKEISYRMDRTVNDLVSVCVRMYLPNLENTPIVPWITPNISDNKEAYTCILCKNAFIPINRNQKICGSVDCKKKRDYAQKRRSITKYLAYEDCDECGAPSGRACKDENDNLKKFCRERKKKS